jgi:hypothetical protein
LGDPLKGNLLLLYKPMHLEAQQVSIRIEVRRHQRIAKLKELGPKRAILKNRDQCEGTVKELGPLMRFSLAETTAEYVKTDGRAPTG